MNNSWRLYSYIEIYMNSHIQPRKYCIENWNNNPLKKMHYSKQRNSWARVVEIYARDIALRYHSLSQNALRYHSLSQNAYQNVHIICDNTVKPVFRGHINTVKSVFKGHLNTVKPVFRGHINTVKPVFKGHLNTVKPVFKGHLNTVKPVFREHLNTVKPIFRGHLNTVKPVFIIPCICLARLAQTMCTKQHHLTSWSQGVLERILLYTELRYKSRWTLRHIWVGTQIPTPSKDPLKTCIFHTSIYTVKPVFKVHPEKVHDRCPFVTGSLTWGR